MNKFTGVVLAGGKSLRMGQDKALLPVGKQLMIKGVLASLKAHSEEIIVVTNKVAEFSFLKVPVFPDIVPGRGPLGGIYTGLIRSKTFHNLIVACDMPFLNQDLVKFMLEEVYDYDVVIPEHNGQLEPLCAIYSKNCIKPIEKELHRNDLKITNFLQYVKVRRITGKETAKFDSEGLSFANINAPEDYNKLKASGGSQVSKNKVCKFRSERGREIL